MNKEEAYKIKKLSDLYWIDEKLPRQFCFVGYFDNVLQVFKAAELIKKHNAENIRIEFSNFDKHNMIRIGTFPLSFNLGHWHYGFTEPLIKDLIKLLGNLWFRVNVENSDGFAYTIDKDLKVIDITEADIGG